MTSYETTTFYSGPLHGWMTVHCDLSTGVSWWLDGNFWRYWDDVAQRWQWTQIRDHKRHGNTWAALVMAIIAFVIGGALGGPAFPLFAVFAVLILLLGFANTHLQNTRPGAYRVVAVASAVYGAKGVYDMTHRHHGNSDQLRSDLESYSDRYNG